MEQDKEIYFCDGCPRKGDCEGPLTRAEPHITDASFFSMSEKAVGIPLNMGTYFFDAEGNKSDYFAPENSLDDVANCNGLEVDFRTGFLWLRARRDCGANIVNIHKFRESLFGSKKPRK